MRRVRIESHSDELIAGFVAGVEWVNDSAIAVVALEDRDGSGNEEVLCLTDNGIEGKE